MGTVADSVLVSSLDLQSGRPRFDTCYLFGVGNLVPVSTGVDGSATAIQPPHLAFGFEQSLATST